MAMKIISVTDIRDFKLGNAENTEKGTGCTVIVCEEGAVGGVDVRGGGPATRETDLLRSENTVNAVNAVVLSGGSAFGLEAASGVMRELADRKIGFDVGDDIVVPIVCGASLYDLPIGDPKAFPDVSMGIQAVNNAFDGLFAKGNHGAGTGATVGKLKGYDRAMKTGLGTFACSDGIIDVGAIAAVNAVGDIYNGAGNIIAGLRSEDGESIYGTIKTLKGMVHDKIKLVDDSTSFINRSEIEEALAAVAKQYEEEKAAAGGEPVPEEVIGEPAEESLEEVPEEEIVPEFVGVALEEPVPEEEPYEETVEEQVEEIIEEPAEVIIEEITDEPVEETVEEQVEEPADEEIHEEESVEEFIEESADEEFIPETPPIEASDTYSGGYDEVSIPFTSPEPVVSEDPEEKFEAEEISEEPVAEPADELSEEFIPEEQPAEEPEEEPTEEISEEHVEEPTPEAEFVEEIIEIPEEEAVSEEETVVEEISDAEPEEEIIEEPAEESIEETTNESAEEPAAEDTEAEPAEEINEEPTPEEELNEETIEEPAVEEIIEEPVVLTREEMGYDIVFNTTISCLITNASLTKSQANKLASILHDAYARAIKPVHGTLDGDTVFVLATGKQPVNFDAFAALATDIMQYAIIDGAMSAESAYGLPSARDMQKSGE